MSEVAESLRRLNVLLEAMFIAHETVYELHRGLVSVDRATSRSRSLLAESARIVLQSAPETSEAVLHLTGRWHEQSMLDPEAAGRTALELQEELARAEAVLRDLLSRESAIASQLRVLAADRR